MKLDYHNFKERVKNLIKQTPLIQEATENLTRINARVYLVGGVVRDLILDLPVGDIDIEVHGVSIKALGDVLKKFGEVSYVGKAFGVLKIHGTNTDWSIPRRDSAGRKPEVTLIPDLTLEEAFSRRDLTMNAMGIDLQSLDLIDPFGGLQDIEKRILRTPDVKKFQEDPLRFYRVMQFVSRFAMEPDDELNAVCKRMDISKVSIERIEIEFEKMCLKSIRPSLGIRWLKKIGRLKEVLPELSRTVSVLQNPEYHPEGDVFEHTMQAIDAAADYVYENNEQKLTILLAALCHDLGKPKTTQERKGRITSYRHEEVGVPIAKSMLKRITTKKTLIAIIAQLVRHHMAPALFVRQDAKPRAYKRLAGKLAPLTTMRNLGLLALADRRGRNGKSHIPLPPTDEEIQEFFKRAQAAKVIDKPEPEILKGRDLLDMFKPGPELGNALAFAYELQIDENIFDKKELRRRVLAKFKS